jgi:REP element-mobilizing transposase RayT
MARLRRSQLPDGLFHVTIRGNRHQATFVDDVDYRWFERKFTDVVRRFKWKCYTLCLMPNHYHALVVAEQAALSLGMEQLNGKHAQRFNLRHAVEGHLFERRFRSWVVESNAHFLRAARYIALNPVEAGLCKHPAEWRWSSYRALAGLEPSPSYLTPGPLLEQFGRDLPSARRAFVAFVAEGMAALVPDAA